MKTPRLILITPPDLQPDDMPTVNDLLATGCMRLHLRLPEASVEQTERYVRCVEPRYRHRIVLHGMAMQTLVMRYGLGGLHLPEHEWKSGMWPALPRGCDLSASCHAIDDLAALNQKMSYLFLSPIYDSISKSGYTASFDTECLRTALTECDTPVYALGGITPQRLPEVINLGFTGAAALGYVWQKGYEWQRWQELNTPEILCIGGTDPCGGAGITADVRTAAEWGVRALPIVTAVTYQNERQYQGTRWMTPEEVAHQIESIAATAHPTVAKIGLIENYWTLRSMVELLHHTFPGIRIVWDPIIRSSTGCCFHSDFALLPEILQQIHVITPNIPEAEKLFGGHIDPEQLAGESFRYGITIVLKGGHAEGDCITDYLIEPGNIMPYTVLRSGHDKHGTGCAHSTALAAAWAQGADLHQATDQAQLWVSRQLRSTCNLLTSPLLGKQQSGKPVITEVRRMFITHEAPGNPSLPMQVEAACRLDVECVQLRMKHASDTEMLEMAYLIRKICNRHGVLFIINDRTHIARQVEADGVHLGQTDMPMDEARRLLGDDMIIGRTCNTPEQALRAYAEGADYIGVGPYRNTQTKDNLSPILGLEGYHRLRSALDRAKAPLPVFAIGGITRADEPLLMQTGIQGVAVSGTLIREIQETIR